MSEFDYAALLARYVELIRSQFRGDDQLDEFSGFLAEDRTEIRRIADARPAGPIGPAFEKVGGNPRRSVFSELNNMPLDDREAACAWQTEKGS